MFDNQTNARHPSSQYSCVPRCSGHNYWSQSQGLRRDWQNNKQPTQAACVLKDLKSLRSLTRDYLQAQQSQWHHPSIAGSRESQEQAAVDDLLVQERRRHEGLGNQSSIGTVLKATSGNLLTPGGAHMSFHERLDTISILTERNRT